MSLRSFAATSLAAVMALLLVSCPGAELGAGRGGRAVNGAVRRKADVRQRRAKKAARSRALAASPRVAAGGSAIAALPAADQAGEWPAPSDTELALLAADSAAERARPEHALAALAKETFVFARPNWASTKIGYLRTGAIVGRSPRAAGYAACDGGWYHIEPEGFVCVGKNATLDLEHPVVLASKTRPDRKQGLPYRYGSSLFPTPPFYARVPSAAEQRRIEPELEGHQRRNTTAAWADAPIGPIADLFQPDSAGDVQAAREWSGGALHRGRAMVKSGFAFLSFFEAEGRRFGVSVDLDVMPLDRLQPVKPSAFAGVQLGDGVDLPVVFANSRGAQLLAGIPGNGFTPVRPLGYREAVAVTGKRVRVSGQDYYETRSGEWIKDENAVFVGPMRNRPGWAGPGRTWIDISILKQTLIAYEGEKPVYVTLVSTGADGMGDPAETHSTIRGQFLIHTKHVTATMSGDEVGDEFDLRDVPYVMYFNEGYALHAVYWHDGFGRPRSHGCVNLAPADARFLFDWSEPQVPEGWHGAMSLREGTLVYVHA